MASAPALAVIYTLVTIPLRHSEASPKVAYISPLHSVAQRLSLLRYPPIKIGPVHPFFLLGHVPRIRPLPSEPKEKINVSPSHTFFSFFPLDTSQTIHWTTLLEAPLSIFIVQSGARPQFSSSNRGERKLVVEVTAMSTQMKWDTASRRHPHTPIITSPPTHTHIYISSALSTDSPSAKEAGHVEAHRRPSLHPRSHIALRGSQPPNQARWLAYNHVPEKIPSKRIRTMHSSVVRSAPVFNCHCRSRRSCLHRDNCYI